MQQDEIILTDPEAVRALYATPITPHFLEPQSPSRVAKILKMPANLVHHHAKRLLEFGVLFEAKREGRRVYYQLAARTFKYPRGLLPIGESEAETMQKLTGAFLRAHERSDRLNVSEDPDFGYCSFADRSLTPTRKHDMTPAEPRPAHYQTCVLKLSGPSYQKFVGRIAQLLAELEAEQGPDAKPCSFAFLAFDGPILEGDTGDSRQISSFMPVTY